MKQNIHNTFAEPTLPQNQVSGILTIVAMPDSNLNKLYETSLSDNQQIDLGDFRAAEWEAIFYQLLHCPVGIDEPLSPNETEEDWQERFSKKFKQTIPKYPMLAELWNLQMYVSYKFEEIKKLHSECINLRSSTSNKKAIIGLTKLIEACDEALKHRYGLLLVPE